MRIGSRLMLVCASLLVACGAGAQEALVPNLDFSDGVKGWTAWTGTTEHPWALDEAVGHGGKPSLRINATGRAGQVMVMTHTDRLKPGVRYGIDAWWRTGNLSPSPQVDLHVIFRDANGVRLRPRRGAARVGALQGVPCLERGRLAIPGAGEALEPAPRGRSIPAGGRLARPARSSTRAGKRTRLSPT